MPFDISRFLPGFKNNTALAEGNIGALLGGQASTAPARSKAAYFGATSGMPNSGVSDALGVDLYGQDQAANQQQGFDNLLKMITGFSGNAFADPGQQMQFDQNQQEFNDRRRREDLARQDGRNALRDADYARRNKRPNGLYRTSGSNGPVPGGGNLPWWA